MMSKGDERISHITDRDKLAVETAMSIKGS